MITNCIHKTTLLFTPLQILARHRADKYDDMICSAHPFEFLRVKQQVTHPSSDLRVNKNQRQTQFFLLHRHKTERVVIIMEYGHVPLSHPLLPMHHPEHGNVIAP